MIGKGEWTGGEANPRLIVTSLRKAGTNDRFLYEKVYCVRGEMENRIKECQGDLFADHTSTATMRANQLWFASFAYGGSTSGSPGRPSAARSRKRQARTSEPRRSSMTRLSERARSSRV